jgi:hypothetical protein
MKSPARSQETVLFKSLLDLSCHWGDSRQNIRRKIKSWMDNQHLAMWRGLSSAQRQLEKWFRVLVRLLIMYRITIPEQDTVQSCYCLLTAHNTLSRYLYIMWLNNSLLRRRCWAEGENSAHIPCEWVLASLRHVYLGFFVYPENLKGLILKAIWNLSEGTGLLWTGIRLWNTKVPFLNSRCIGTVRARTQLLINQEPK